MNQIRISLQFTEGRGMQSETTWEYAEWSAVPRIGDTIDRDGAEFEVGAVMWFTFGSDNKVDGHEVDVLVVARL